MAKHARSASEVRSTGGAIDRQRRQQGSARQCRRKRGAEAAAIGRSRGDRGTKIHAVVDTTGRMIAFDLTSGQRGDERAARSLLEPLPVAAFLSADAAFDSDGFRGFLSDRGAQPAILPTPRAQERPAI